MNPTLIATIAGLATALSWGTSDWMAARSTRKLTPVEINFALQATGMLVVAVLYVFSFHTVHMPTGDQILTIATGSALITAAFLLFVQALSSGIIGIISPIGNSYPLVTVILSAIFLSEVFTGRQVGAILAIVLGAALLAHEKNTANVPLRELHKETLLAIGAALTWGVAFFVMDGVVGKVSWQTITIGVEIWLTIIAFVLLVAVNRSKTLSAARKSLSSRTALLTGVIGTVGGITFYAGSNASGSIIIPTVLSSAGPLVTSVLGAVYDHEKIGALKRAGAVLLVAGIIILNVA